MKFFDLFSGIGGFRVGLEANGHECVGSCEIDKYARQIYAKNFGHEPEYKDVREINPKDLPYFDILCAGFPCQAFSLAGNRGGFEDTRGTLFFEIARIAREKQPSILFLENVKGLLSHDKGETFRVILETLDECGYDVTWQIINSKYFLPQNRERVYLVANLRGSSRRKVLPIGQICSGNVEPQREEKYKSNVNIIGNKNPSGKGQGGNVYSVDGVSPTLCAGATKGYGNGFIAEPKLKLHKNSEDDSYRVYETDGISRTLRANSGGLGSKTGVYNMGNSRFRRLTPLECERLQGFEDRFTEGVSDTQRYKMLGNAVTTKVVEYIGGLL